MSECGDQSEEFSMGEGTEEGRRDDGCSELGGGRSLGKEMGDEGLMGRKWKRGRWLVKVSKEYGVLPRWDDCHGLAVPVPDCWTTRVLPELCPAGVLTLKYGNHFRHALPR